MARTSNKDSRPRVDVSRGVKSLLRELRGELKYDLDTETIAYLIALLEDKKKTITLIQDADIRKRAEEINSQQTI